MEPHGFRAVAPSTALRREKPSDPSDKDYGRRAEDILFAYSAEAAASAAKAGRQGFGGYPHSFPLSQAGLSPLRGGG